MGFSIATVAIRGKDASAIHVDFGVKPTGEWVDEPDAPVVGVQLPSGWYLLFVNDRVAPSKEELQRLSTRAELVCCNVEEHVMCSSAQGWANGLEVWSVVHDAQQGASHLDARGTLPPFYSEIAESLRARQLERGDADYLFDIPVELSRRLTGFRHDAGDYPVDQFEVLQRVRAVKKWWEFWK